MQWVQGQEHAIGISIIQSLGSVSQWVCQFPLETYLSFFRFGVAKTQLNHWTKRVVNTRLITLITGDPPGFFFGCHESGFSDE